MEIHKFEQTNIHFQTFLHANGHIQATKRTKHMRTQLGVNVGDLYTDFQLTSALNHTCVHA